MILAAHATTADSTACDVSCAGVEVGGYADGTPHTSSRVVVATYNIRYAVGSRLISGSLFRRLGFGRPARRAELIRRNLDRAAVALAAGESAPPIDILALQEADAETRRSGGRHVAAELAARFAARYAFAPMNTPRDAPEAPKRWYLDFEEHIAPDDRGDTGVALLSRLPFARVERVDLPWTLCPWRPRLAIHGEFRIGTRSLHVFNAHIDTHATTGAQLAQHEEILRRAATCAERGDAVLVAGDFNTLTRGAAVRIREFFESRGYSTPLATGTTTWRAGLIRLHPDWIFARNLRVVRHGVLTPRGISDHFPVWVEIDVVPDRRGERA